MSQTPVIKAAIPNLPSLNFDRTIEFYTGKLGMKMVARHRDYLLLERDGVEIHFWLCADPAIPGSSSCYMRVENIEALYLGLQERGVSFRTPLRKQPWGMREFLIQDPDGNNVRVGEPAK